MNHKMLVLFFLFTGQLVQFGCNPDCTSISGLSLSTTVNAAGHEILISATPPDILKNRKVFFNDNEADNVEYIEGYGLRVRVPDNMPAGKVDLKIEDPDCADFITVDFDVVENNFFVNNPEYVFPPLPEIIIPTLPPPSFPVSIENAWLGANDLDYCMWFKFVKDYEITDDGDTIGYACTNVIDSENSFEQCFANCSGRCSGVGSDSDCLYDDNPISGIIDPSNNYIHITVDRTRWGGGYEEFSGQFINPAETGQYQVWEAGTEPTSVDGLPINKVREHMILLTSLKNGRKLLIYQQGINPAIVPSATLECI